MEEIAEILNRRKKVTKSAAYRWQEQIDFLSKQTGLSFGLLCSIWRKYGYKILDSLVSQLKQGEITSLQAKKYLLWNLKNNK